MPPLLGSPVQVHSSGILGLHFGASLHISSQSEPAIQPHFFQSSVQTHESEPKEARLLCKLRPCLAPILTDDPVSTDLSPLGALFRLNRQLGVPLTTPTPVLLTLFTFPENSRIGPSLCDHSDETKTREFVRPSVAVSR